MGLTKLFGDALPIITKFAPTIGAAIGSPIGVVAGYVIPILASAFKHDPSDIGGLVQKILNDTDAQSKLQALEHDHGDWICTLKDSVGNLTKAEIHINLEWGRL